MTELTSEIKKEHKIEEIRKKVKEHVLFKKFQIENPKSPRGNKGTRKPENKNQDEIQELISIFYNFFIDDNHEENKLNFNNVNGELSQYGSQADYPRNLYYDPSAEKDVFKNHKNGNGEASEIFNKNVGDNSILEESKIEYDDDQNNSQNHLNDSIAHIINQSFTRNKTHNALNATINDSEDSEDDMMN